MKSKNGLFCNLSKDSSLDLWRDFFEQSDGRIHFDIAQQTPDDFGSIPNFAWRAITFIFCFGVDEVVLNLCKDLVARLSPPPEEICFHVCGSAKALDLRRLFSNPWESPCPWTLKYDVEQNFSDLNEQLTRFLGGPKISRLKRLKLRLEGVAVLPENVLESIARSNWLERLDLWLLGLGQDFDPPTTLKVEQQASNTSLKRLKLKLRIPAQRVDRANFLVFLSKLTRFARLEELDLKSLNICELEEVEPHVRRFLTSHPRLQKFNHLVHISRTAVAKARNRPLRLLCLDRLPASEIDCLLPSLSDLEEFLQKT